MAAVLTNTGMAGIAARINGSGTPAAYTYVAVGTGTTAAAAADTTLEAEIVDSGLARATDATPTVTTTTVTNDTAVCDVTFTVTGTKAVTECGLLNAASTGVLLFHDVFSAYNVVSGDTLTVTCKVKVQAA
jgi:hypothetical protein